MIWLSTLDPAQARFGGKASGLARLMRVGARVPEGFAVAATHVAPGRWNSERRAQAVELVRGLLKGGAIAVRSSAIGEDSTERSFAGLLDSFLDVRDLDGFFVAAAACIASGASERVRAYLGDGADPLPVGLVVQRMIPARAAGVIFTRDPAGPGLALEAVQGTGDRLVSGRETPERWTAYRTGTGQIEIVRGTGAGFAAPADPGNAATGAPGTAATVSVLAEGQVRELAQIAWALEQEFGHPLDLEWAIGEDGAIWWLQARPITATRTWLPPDVVRTAAGVDDGPVTVWGNWNVRETMPDPLSPLTWSIWRDTVIPALVRDFLGIPDGSPQARLAAPLDLIDGRVYFNMNAMLASPLLGRNIAMFMDIVDREAGVVVKDLISAGVLQPRRLPPVNGATMALHNLLGQLRRLPWLLDPRRGARELAECGDRLEERPALATLDDEALLRELHLFNDPRLGRVRDGLAMAQVTGMLWLAADRAFRPWPEARRLLSTGVEGNPTTDISLDLDVLIEAALPLGDRFPPDEPAETVLEGLQTAPEARDWLRRLDAFLVRHGHRTPREFELATPRWVDDPARIVDLVRAGVRDPQRVPVCERLAQLKARRQEAINAALAAAPVIKRPLLRWLAAATRASMPLREAPKHQAMRVFLRVRHAALELGQRLVARHLLAAPDDVFFLTVDQLAGATRGEDAREHAAAGREALARYQAAPAPTFVRSDWVPVAPPEGARDLPPGIMRGVGVGGGVGEGPATLLDEPDPGKVRQGDVLVMRFADPGWTPLFPRAAGVVMEVGGTMCHAAVIARELGIPAVFGVPDATRSIPPGAPLVVDGDQGLVRIAGEC